MNYTERFKKICKYTLIGFGVGFAIALLLGILARDFFMTVILTIMLGPIASIFISSKYGFSGMFGNIGINWLKDFMKSMIRGALGGNIIFSLFILIVKLILMFIILIPIAVYSSTSYIIHFIYYGFMALNEKFSFIKINNSTGVKIDKTLNILIIVFTAIISVTFIRAIFSDNSSKTVVYSTTITETRSGNSQESDSVNNDDKEIIDSSQVATNEDTTLVVSTDSQESEEYDYDSNEEQLYERYIPITEKYVGEGNIAPSIDGHYYTSRYLEDVYDDLLQARIEDNKLFLDASVIIDPTDTSIDTEKYWGTYYSYTFELADDLKITPYIVSSKDYETLSDGHGVLPSSIEEFNDRFNGRDKDGELEFDVVDGKIHEIIIKIWEEYAG